jgi:hypothetical protein
VSEPALPQGQPGPELDRAALDWHGSFPGLGSLDIHADGSVRVAPDGAEREREAALRHGWADLLAFSQLGFSMAAGAVLAPGPDASGALLVCGDPPEVAAVALGLTAHGWSLVSDRPTPTQWEHAALVAHPRPAPLIVGRHLASLAGRDRQSVRTGSDALAIDVNRRSTPVQVSAIARVQRRRPDEDRLTELHGHRRLERAATIMIGGALSAAGADADPTAVVDEHLRLAGLPWCEARIDEDTHDTVGALIAWWTDLAREPA